MSLLLNGVGSRGKIHAESDLIDFAHLLLWDFTCQFFDIITQFAVCVRISRIPGNANTETLGMSRSDNCHPYASSLKINHRGERPQAERSC